MNAEPGELVFEENWDDFNMDIWEHELTMGGGGNWEFQEKVFSDILDSIKTDFAKKFENITFKTQKRRIITIVQTATFEIISCLSCLRHWRT